MITIKNIKRWYVLHKWTSLVCTLFLLNLCLTGLPLVFAEEIDEWLNPGEPYEVLANNAPAASLDSIVSIAKQKYPGEAVESVFMDEDGPGLFVGMMPTLDADEDLAHYMQFDRRTGRLMKDEPPFAQQPQTFIGLMLSLHVDLFMELPGELFLGLMGVLFIVAIISGIMLYGPFMKKVNFGTVRYGRSKRLKWLDLHNLSGIIVMAWMLVVGITGVINELSTPLFALWQNTEVKGMLDKYNGKQQPKPEQLSSVQAAFDTAGKTLPGMEIVSIVFPGAQFGSPYHYLLWAKGDRPLTSRLFSPVLVDGETGQLAAVVKMPLYLRSLEISRPLHFGDYGGIPLKIIWALLDLVVIFVLISGIYLWFKQRKSRDAWLQKLLQNETENENENAA